MRSKRGIKVSRSWFAAAAAVLILLTCPLKAIAAQTEAPAAKPRSQEPIRITSKTLEADDAALRVTFSGEVKAVQGDATLYCDQMIVHYVKVAPKPGQSKEDVDREIKKIEAKGHVKVIQKDKTAVGREGVYEMEAGRVVLWGEPKIVQGQNVITGERVIVYLDEDRAIVQSGAKPVEAIIVPGAGKTPLGGRTPKKKSAEPPQAGTD